MSRDMNRLNALSVPKIKKPGRHADGGNLYLSVSPNGGRSWVFLYRWLGKPTEIGLGSARKGHVKLAAARKLAEEARAQLANRVNPKDARAPVKVATFGECAKGYIDANKPGWKNGKHLDQWRMTLLGINPKGKPAKIDYCKKIRNLGVDSI